MRIIVNDTSCLIDLRKAGLLHSALLLPYHFQIALPLIEAELLDFTPADFEDLKARGLEIVDLPPDKVGRAFALRAAHPALSINDCFSIALTETHDDGILLTGDNTLRKKATEIGLEVHGVLWISDGLEQNHHVAYQALLDGLLILKDDPVVFLPNDELEIRIQRLRAKLGQA